MNQSSALHILLVTLLLFTYTVSKAAPVTVKSLNKYGGFTTNASTFVNKNGAIGLGGINGNGKTVQVPLLAATTSVTSIGTTSGTSGGNILSDGGATITARGVCYGLTSNPTLSNGFTTNGTGTGIFSSSIASLTSSTTYYVRSYATNIIGTGYGTQVSFQTITCFIAGTKITMENGGLKNIEEVKVGDKVKTVDPANMQVASERVIRIFVHPASNDLIKITFSNGQATTNTKSHPYWAEGKGWSSVDPGPFKDTRGINAKQLLAGDTCTLLKNGQMVAVKILKIENLPNLLVPTYNFEVNKTHCYFANGILVHNY